MPGLVPGIHVFPCCRANIAAWIAVP